MTRETKNHPRKSNKRLGGNGGIPAGSNRWPSTVKEDEGAFDMRVSGNMNSGKMENCTPLMKLLEYFSRPEAAILIERKGRGSEL